MVIKQSTTPSQMAEYDHDPMIQKRADKKQNNNKSTASRHAHDWFLSAWRQCKIDNEKSRRCEWLVALTSHCLFTPADHPIIFVSCMPLCQGYTSGSQTMTGHQSMEFASERRSQWKISWKKLVRQHQKQDNNWTVDVQTGGTYFSALINANKTQRQISTKSVNVLCEWHSDNHPHSSLKTQMLSLILGGFRGVFSQQVQRGQMSWSAKCSSDRCPLCEKN